MEAVRPADIEPIRRWRNAQLRVLRQASPISPRQQIAYYRKQVWPDMRSARPANILLAYRERGSLIGYGGLVHIAWEHRRAEVSFLLKPALARARAQYARCFSGFLRLVRMLAFDDLGLERLHTETYAFRRQHIAVLEAAGFRREGVLRRHMWIDGKPIDALLHACVRTDER